jgi:hypothetical protein
MMCPANEEEKRKIEYKPYAQIVGSILYAMLCTRRAECVWQHSYLPLYFFSLLPKSQIQNILTFFFFFLLFISHQ